VREPALVHGHAAPLIASADVRTTARRANVRDASDAARLGTANAKAARERSRALAIVSRSVTRGFTLVEMLAVIVILALIATMVTVNWQAMVPKADLHSAVRTLASTLQTAHSEAISRNAVYRIEYDLDKHRYRLNTPFKLGGGAASREEDRQTLPWTNLPETVRFNRIQIDGVDYARGMVYVRFDPLGAASGHVLTLVQKPYDNYYTIEVQSLTGLIDYHEGQFMRLPPKESDF
jgi:type II secretion system protein H